MKKRLLSLVLVFSFIFGTLPANVLAGAMQAKESETITGNGKYNVKHLDDIIGPININGGVFPEGYVAVKFFADDSEDYRGEFTGDNKAVVVYAVNPKNTEIDTDAKTLKGKKADGSELNITFPTYTVKQTFQDTWKKNDKAPWKMNHEKAIGSDKKIDVKKLGEYQDLTFTAQYEKQKGKVNYVYEYKNKKTITDSDKTDIPALPINATEYEVGTKVNAETTVAKNKTVTAKDKSGKVIGFWKFSGWAPTTLEIKKGENKFIGTWTFTESIASILKDKLDLQDISVWLKDDINWKNGVKLKEGTVDTDGKLKGLLDKATVTDESNRNSNTVGEYPGTLKLAFEDGSELKVDKQNLYVKDKFTSKDDKNAPKDAIEVKFYLGEGVKVVKGDVTTEGNKDNPKLYATYKIKPGTDLGTYKHSQLKETIFELINAKANKGYSAPVTWKGNKASDPKNYIVSKENNEFTAKATKIFTVKHEFVSGTEGKVLPTTGMPNVPEAVTDKKVGSTVNAPTKTYKDVKVAEGTWTFKGWSPKTLRVSETDKDNKFVGKWEFTPDKKTVNLTFEFYKKKDSGNVQQPDNALGDFKKPKLENLTGKEVGAEIDLPKYQGQTVNTGDLQGTWEFDGWYRGDKKLTNAKVSAIDAENKLVGKWILTETKTAIVSHEFKIDPSIVGNDKVVKPTHELPQGVKNQKRQQTTNYVGSIVNPISKPAFTAVPETINGKQGTWTFKEWTPKELIVNKDESKNVFTGTWTFTESIASILKDKLDLQDISVWLKDDINWKNGVKLKEGTVDTDGKLKGLLDKATVTDESNRNSNTVGEYPGTLKLAFEDGSELKVDKQNLYVKDKFTSKDDKNAPKDAIEVKFYLGEGVKVVKGDVTTEGNKDNPKLYATYKIKPGTDLGTYKHSQLKETIFELINAKANKGYSAPVTWKGNKASDPKNYIVSKENNEFTAKATKIFTVKHEFVSGTEGKVLPTTGMPNVPEAVTDKKVGSTVNAPTKTYKDVKVAEGTWTFKGWSPKTLRVSETDKDNKFVGKWEFTPDKKTVNLTFEFYKKKDSGNVQQPDNALGDFKKPKLENLTGKEVGAEIDLPKYQGQTVNTGDLQGTWEFDGWYRGDKKLTNAKVSAIDAENKLVGKWILTETKTAIVSHEFKIDPSIVGNDKVVKPTHELPQGVKNQKRQQTTNYVGSIVNPISKPAFTAVPETINGKQGTWTFKEWTPKELTVNKEEAKNVFTGTWTWTEKDKIEVKYVFETKPNNKTLPEALKALKPEDRVGDKAVYEDNKPADPKAPDTSSEAAQKALVEMKGGNKVGE